VLRGEVTLRLRVPAQPVTGRRKGKTPVAGRAGSRAGTGAGAGSGLGASPLPLGDAGLALFAALKAWRAEVARSHGLPAYVIFHDATLAQMAQERPATLDALAGIGGVGAKKLQAYGAEILRVVAAGAASAHAAGPAA
jgi:ATP-dependent DNA helicase RecQ